MNPVNTVPEVEGIVVMGDLETFEYIQDARVIIFDDTQKALESFDNLEKTGNVDFAFKLALEGHAEEISVQKLVQFYIQNS